MSRESNVVKFYSLCNKLKDVVRTGWKDWGVNRERIESVAEHIFGVQMLAIAMHSEYKYDIDIFKVIFMLSVHEIEEILIGDLTQFEMTREEKKEIGHKAIAKVLENLIDKQQITDLIFEFDEGKTREAKFAFWCDKLECDLQSKLYDEENCVDLKNQKNNKTFYDERVQRLLKEGNSWSDMWLDFGQEVYDYDDNFRAISNYAKNNSIRIN